MTEREAMETGIKVQITGMTRLNLPKPNQGGSRVLAYFDCQVGPFLLLGCAFVRTSKNGLTVWAPKLDTPGIHRTSITIIDSAARHRMTVAAQEMYRLLGGTDGEWTPRPAETVQEGSDAV